LAISNQPMKPQDNDLKSTQHPAYQIGPIL
jgi:hypothetical protein